MRPWLKDSQLPFLNRWLSPHLQPLPQEPGHYIQSLISPGSALRPYSSLKLLMLANHNRANPNPACPACRNHNKGTCPQLPALTLPRDCSASAECSCVSPQGTVRHKTVKLFQASPNLFWTQHTLLKVIWLKQKEGKEEREGGREGTTLIGS